MKFDRRKPCGNCPFRNDKDFHLTAERAHGIVETVVLLGKTFTCHKTLGKKEVDQSHCAGALILIKKENAPHTMVCIAERLGLYKPSKLKMDSPVFDSVKDMKNHYTELEGRR